MSLFSKYFSRPTPQIQLVQSIDVSQNPCYHTALLFTVTNGIGALTKTSGKGAEQLLLHGIPLLETRYPGCPTCASTLQRGYDLKLADCPELYAVSEFINQSNASITDALEQLSPLLGLLQDGPYLLADVPHFPTDGDGRFFWNAPYQPLEITAACASLYCCELLTAIESRPAYLYPTQSTDCLHEARVAYYLEQFHSGRTPHGIAYHTDGFISALLDGHHKACAAALLGQSLDCFTIIPITKTYNDKTYFCDLSVCTQNFSTSKQLRKQLLNHKPAHLQKLHSIPTAQTRSTLPEFYNEAAKQFPKIHDFAMELELGAAYATDDDIAEWLKKPSILENAYKLQYLLQFRSRQKDSSVRELALRILNACRTPDISVSATYYNAPESLLAEAFRALLAFKDTEVEQVFINYLVTYSPNHSLHRCDKIVNSYWTDEV